MRTIMIIATAIAAIAFASAPASAGSPIAPTARVTYADLDLAKLTDRARLNRRIATSLETVCGSYAASSDEEVREITRCRAAALAQGNAAMALLMRGETIQLATR